MKHVDLANSLRLDILSGKFSVGQKLPSENELSQRLGFSRQTIRQAMDTLRKEKLLERKRGSGTYVAFKEKETRKPTMNIGVISTYMDSYIFPSIIRGIDNVLKEQGYMMQLTLTHNQVKNEAGALRMLLKKNVDGLIVEPAQSGLPNINIELYRQIKQRNIPIVFFNAHYPHWDSQYVCMNDRLAGFKAAKCLIDAGHRVIAGMFKADDSQGQLRYLGFMEALNEAGLDADSSRIIWFVTEDIPYLTEDIARVKRALTDCTGLVFYNDQTAFTIVPELIKEGYCIPDGLSVVGIDNADIASFCEVPLTSVAHPMDKLGQVAAQSILKLIQNPDEQVTVEFEPELIIRKSVKNISEGGSEQIQNSI